MRQFASVTLDEFVELIDHFTFIRTITDVHLHHSWRPRGAEFLGQSTLQEMWREHTEVMRWSDLAQHATVAPDGHIWLGRSFNRAPASAKGFNGNDRAGPFMLVMIGDFDSGEAPTQAQMHAALGAIAAVQRRWHLPREGLRLHGELTGARCPGLARGTLLADLAKVQLPATGAPNPFAGNMTRVGELLQALAGAESPPEDMSSAELPHGPAAGRSRAGGVTRADLADFRDHWINLDRGAFSDDGRIKTGNADVDRIFGERLRDEIAKAKDRGRPLDLLLYAHGGLVPESTGIEHMVTQTPTWRSNDVFPIYFIWETGFLRAIRDLLLDAFRRRERARLPGVDRVLEEAARAFGGVSIWEVMKLNAARASEAAGGANYAAGLLKDLMKTHGADLRVHAVGHSAGAIFHAHFLHQLLGDGKRRLQTLSLLAPAARTDLFRDRIAPLIQKDLIGETTIYTMNDSRERADSTTAPYGKSLLYLIRGALEEKREADLLGLEISLRDDPALAAAFGLNGAPIGINRVIFAGDPGSKSPAAQAMGRATDSTSHGGFDNDPLTMNSVLRRVTGRISGEPIEPFTASAGRSPDIGADDLAYLPEALADAVRSITLQAPAPSPAPVRPAPVAPGNGGRPGVLRALCIGIDHYREITPLSGCINDAEAWRGALESFGFEARRMPEDDATAEGIRDRVGQFVSEARAGDTFVIHYSGHGTQFQDAGGEEPDGQDEAICAIDCGMEGATGLVLDDQFRDILGGVDSGATLICFFDSCHSGTVTRLGLDRQMRARGFGPQMAVPRRVSPTPAMKQAYARLVASGPRRRDLQQPMREVVFSACQPHQLAYERDGQGDFTRNALQVLKNGGARPSNSGFMNQVAQFFGGSALQSPLLDCAPGALETPFTFGSWT